MCRIDLNKIKTGFLLIPLVMLTWVVFGQEAVVVKITDQKGNPVPFATILTVDGKGLIADASGILNLDETKGQSIRVKAMGFEELDFQADPQNKQWLIQLKESTNDLKEVVVTGEPEATSARQSVYQIRTIDKGTIQQRAAGNLQEVLNTELGIRFSQDNALGTTNLEMLGLSGQNVKVLLDGIPMVGRQGVSNEININQIDINRIERVELVEGPMSVIYGADALAGVINIITKKEGEGNKWDLRARVQEETVGTAYNPFSGSGNHIQNLQGNYVHGDYILSAGLTRNQFGGWKGDYTGRQFEWLPKDQWLGNASIGIQKDKYNLNYSLNTLSETIKSFGPESRLENIDMDFESSRWMHSLQGAYHLKPTFSINGQAAFTDYTRRTATWITNVRTGEKYQSSAEGAMDKLEYQGWNIRAVASWRVAGSLSLQPGIDFNLENGVGDRLSENEGQGDYAVFLTGEWSPVEAIKVRPGIRSVYNTAYEAPPVIPSLNTKFILSDGLYLRLAYARGFRAPSLRELHFDFFDASHSIRGNPDLEAETSHSYNSSLNFRHQLTKKHLLTTVLTGFYNDIDNRIAYGIDPDDFRITTLFNLEKFKTRGFTINQKWANEQLQANAGFSRIGRYNQLFESEGTNVPQFLWTNEVNANISYKINPLDTHINLYYKWTGDLPSFQLSRNESGEAVPRLVEIEGFHWLDLTFQKDFGKHLSLNMGVRNLTNVTSIMSTAEGGAHGGGPQRPMGYGRSYFMGLTYQLSH